MIAAFLLWQVTMYVVLLCQRNCNWLPIGRTRTWRSYRETAEKYQDRYNPTHDGRQLSEYRCQKTENDRQILENCF